MRLTPRRPKRAAPATATPLDEDGKPTVEGSISLVRNAMRLKPNISEKSEGKRGAKTGRGGGLATRTFSPAKSLSRRDRERTQTQRVHFRYFLRHVERASLLPPIVDLYRLALTFRPPQTVRAAGSTISHRGQSPACTPRRSWMRASRTRRAFRGFRCNCASRQPAGCVGTAGRRRADAAHGALAVRVGAADGDGGQHVLGDVWVELEGLSVSNSAGAFGCAERGACTTRCRRRRRGPAARTARGGAGGRPSAAASGSDRRSRAKASTPIGRPPTRAARSRRRPRARAKGRSGPRSTRRARRAPSTIRRSCRARSPAPTSEAPRRRRAAPRSRRRARVRARSSPQPRGQD